MTCTGFKRGPEIRTRPLLHVATENWKTSQPLNTLNAWSSVLWKYTQGKHIASGYGTEKGGSHLGKIRKKREVFIRPMFCPARFLAIWGLLHARNKERI